MYIERTGKFADSHATLKSRSSVLTQSLYIIHYELEHFSIGLYAPWILVNDLLLYCTGECTAFSYKYLLFKIYIHTLKKTYIITYAIIINDKNKCSRYNNK